MLIIDVREANEYSQEAAVGTVNLPLSRWSENMASVSEWSKKQDLAFVCASGMRAKQAYEQLLKFDPTLEANLTLLASFKDLDSFTTEKSSGFKMSVMRQVLTIAGFLVLSFSLLSLSKPDFVWGAVFVGVGLAFAGLTGICAMAKLLMLMPWNK